MAQIGRQAAGNRQVSSFNPDLDNPNYFDEEVATKSNETNSKSFFLFKKRHFSGKLVTSKPVTINTDLQPGAHKRRGSFKGLLRSRSNSTTSPSVKTAATFETSTRKHNTLDYRNHAAAADSIRDRWDSYNDSFSENSANDDVFYSNSIDSKCSSSLFQGRRRENLRSEETISGETRRHSIGTFMMKEHMRTGSISDELGDKLCAVVAENHRLSPISDQRYTPSKPLSPGTVVPPARFVIDPKKVTVRLLQTLAVPAIHYQALLNPRLRIQTVPPLQQRTYIAAEGDH
ncbi:hypothetical protein RP20_CCG008072 [Aedes albopictus]|nr:hypothetical protein RP20_CCG008072 [Aedes albopictus]